MPQAMKKIFQIILVLLATQEICFAKWSELGINREFKLSVYVNDEILGKNTNFPRIKILYSYAKPSFDAGVRHASEIEMIKYVCKNHQFMIESVEWFSRPMGEGRVVWKTRNLDLQALESGTAYEDVYKQVCK